VTSRIRDVATAVIVQFVTTFAVWILAERLHLSGIITVVVFAILVARRAPDQMPARLRIQSYAVWEVAVFVFNALAFILVGLQLKPILLRLTRAELIEYTGAAAAICLAVILVRIVWVMLSTAVARRRGTRFSSREALVVAWCGMRGIVTLAAALALPAIPFRAFILFTAFCVVLATLVVQGMTLSPLMRLLRLTDDGSVEREVRLARTETLRAALDAVDGADRGGEMVRFLRRKYEARLQRAEADGADEPLPDGAGWDEYGTALDRAQRAQRRTLSQLRAQGVIGDDAFHLLEEELDWAEVNPSPRRDKAGERA
jgi:monovalent cation/hydrogen antiporter